MGLLFLASIWATMVYQLFALFTWTFLMDVLCLRPLLATFGAIIWPIPWAAMLAALPVVALRAAWAAGRRRRLARRYQTTLPVARVV